AERLFGLDPAEIICCLSRQEINESQLTIPRPMGSSKMGRNHTKDLAIGVDQWRRLYRPYACLKQNLHRRLIVKDFAPSHVLHDDSLLRAHCGCRRDLRVLRNAREIAQKGLAKPM